MNTVIEFKDIKKAYGQQTIVEHFNLTIERGQFVTIIGSSGCGKTTILKMINGLIAPDEGTVYVEGKDIKNEDLIALRRNIGYSIQGSVLFPHMTVEKNIAYVPELLNKDDKARTRAAVEKWMKIVGLDPQMLKRFPDELSGGQQQRVGVARALVVDPDIIFADEPTGNLDSHTSEEVMELMQRVVREQKKTLVMVTHDDHLATYADRVFHIRDGRIIKIEDNRWKKGKEEGGRHAETNTERDRK